MIFLSYCFVPNHQYVSFQKRRAIGIRNIVQFMRDTIRSSVWAQRGMPDQMLLTQEKAIAMGIEYENHINLNTNGMYERSVT